MRLHMILVVGFVLIAAGCAEEQQAASEAMDEAPVTASDAVAVTPGDEIWQNATFRQHMHLHAEKLDEINYALADGNLDAVKEPAKWLADHDTEIDVQSDWLPHLYRMRTEAEALEAAPDIATARAAAQRITMQCQECHVAVGIDTQ